MKYFVTGATGFIGGRLAEKLVGEGHEVVALVRSPEKAEPLRALGVTIAEGDITDKESMRAPMEGCDGVYHVAAWYKVGAKDSHVAEAINVDGTRNTLEVMKELGIPKGVYTSTLAVHSNTNAKAVDETYKFEGEHLSEYDRTKWKAHYEVAVPMMDEGLPLVIVMPGAVYGPGDTSTVASTFAQYLQGKMPMIPKNPAFCWGYIDDTVDGHIAAMEKGRVGESYHIAGPVHSLPEVFGTAQNITGIPAPKMRAGKGMLKTMAAMMGVVGTVVDLPSDFHPETLRVMSGATYLGDSTKAQNELGFNARPLEEGLRLTLPPMMEDLGIIKVA